MKTLLIVWHSRTGAAQQMAHAAARGARREAGVKIRMVAAPDAEAEDVLSADAYLFCAPENLAGLSGEMKAFFDRTYYPVLERVAGRSYGLMIAAGSDGQGAARQVARIVQGWRLRPAADPIIVCTRAQSPEAILAAKTVPPDQLRPCVELGQALAAGLALGVF